MTERDKLYEWIERLVDGHPIPPEIAEEIESNPEAKQYKACLEQIAHTLQDWEIPAPSSSLVDDVMVYIKEQEQQAAPPINVQEPTSFYRWLQDSIEYAIGCFQIPSILRREAFPTAFATLVVVFGIFIVPQVEADKISTTLHNPIASKMLDISDRFIEERDRLTEKLTSFASGFISNSTDTEKNIQQKSQNTDINSDGSSYNNKQTLPLEDNQ